MLAICIANCEQKSGDSNDLYAIAITKKSFLMQTACSTLLICLLAAFWKVKMFWYYHVVYPYAATNLIHLAHDPTTAVTLAKMDHGAVTQSRHCVILKLKFFQQCHAVWINMTTCINLKWQNIIWSLVKNLPNHQNKHTVNYYGYTVLLPFSI